MSRPKLQVIEILNQKPRELPLNTLPTNEEVILALQHSKQCVNLDWQKTIKNVALKVIEIWNKATIPTNSSRRVVSKVQELNQAFLKLKNTPQARKDGEQYIEKCAVFCVSFFLHLFSFVSD